MLGKFLHSKPRSVLAQHEGENDQNAGDEDDGTKDEKHENWNADRTHGVRRDARAAHAARITKVAFCAAAAKLPSKLWCTNSTTSAAIA